MKGKKTNKIENNKEKIEKLWERKEKTTEKKMSKRNTTKYIQFSESIVFIEIALGASAKQN